MVDPIVNLHSGSYGSYGVILMRPWHAKESHDRITNQLVNVPSVFRDDAGSFREDFTHDLFYFFGIELF